VKILLYCEYKEIIGVLVSRVAKCSQMPYLYFETASNCLRQRNSALAEWRRKRDELKAKRDRGIEYEPGPKGKEPMKMKSSRLRKSFPIESKKPTSEIVVENDTQPRSHQAIATLDVLLISYIISLLAKMRLVLGTKIRSSQDIQLTFLAGRTHIFL